MQGGVWGLNGGGLAVGKVANAARVEGEHLVLAELRAIALIEGECLVPARDREQVVLLFARRVPLQAPYWCGALDHVLLRAALVAQAHLNAAFLMGLSGHMPPRAGLHELCSAWGLACMLPTETSAYWGRARLPIEVAECEHGAVVGPASG